MGGVRYDVYLKQYQDYNWRQGYRQCYSAFQPVIQLSLYFVCLFIYSYVCPLLRDTPNPGCHAKAWTKRRMFRRLGPGGRPEDSSTGDLWPAIPKHWQSLSTGRFDGCWLLQGCRASVACKLKLLQHSVVFVWGKEKWSQSPELTLNANKRKPDWNWPLLLSCITFDTFTVTEAVFTLQALLYHDSLLTLNIVYFWTALIYQVTLVKWPSSA